MSHLTVFIFSNTELNYDVVVVVFADRVMRWNKPALPRVLVTNFDQWSFNLKRNSVKVQYFSLPWTKHLLWYQYQHEQQTIVFWCDDFRKVSNRHKSHSIQISDRATDWCRHSGLNRREIFQVNDESRD